MAKGQRPRSRGSRTDRSSRGEAQAARRHGRAADAGDGARRPKRTSACRASSTRRAPASAPSEGASAELTTLQRRARPDPHPRQRHARAARSAQPVRPHMADEARHLGRDPRAALPDPQRAGSGVRGAARAATSTRRCAPPPTRRPTGDSLRLAVLAALNIADELFPLPRRHAAAGTASSPSAPASSSGWSIALSDWPDPLNAWTSGISTPEPRPER